MTLQTKISASLFCSEAPKTACGQGGREISARQRGRRKERERTELQISNRGDLICYNQLTLCWTFVRQSANQNSSGLKQLAVPSSPKHDFSKGQGVRALFLLQSPSRHVLCHSSVHCPLKSLLMEGTDKPLPPPAAPLHYCCRLM